MEGSTPSHSATRRSLTQPITLPPWEVQTTTLCEVSDRAITSRGLALFPSLATTP